MARSASFPTLALVTGLLLLFPSLFVFPTVSPSLPARASPAVAASPQVPSSRPSLPSSYRSIGTADPNLPVLVSVAIPLRNLPMLSSVVKQVSDPASAEFDHFLNYSQVSHLFLPTQSQYQSVVDYLTASGFSIQFSALNSMIVVQGTAGQVSQYMGQSVQVLSNGTYSYYETTGASTLRGAFSYGSNASGLLVRPNFIRANGLGSGTIPAGNVTFTEGGQSTKLLQTVYNSTGLLAKGVNGKGYTIGLLDFYGSNSIAQDLAIYDKTYGFPAPPSFTIKPIGLYNPNLGTVSTWDIEIGLDVQVSHAMAPGANLILYAGNGALPLSTAVAGVVQDHKANVVSQSFGIPEWEYYEAGPLPYLFNSVFADDYYMLGSSMGMTFLASSGDAGGSGYSAGPQGDVEYPSSSPFVTAVGGTATYVSKTASGALSFNQTAWSNLGFVPYFVNQGGAGGGVSDMEPLPWYQSSLPVPATFPNGRLVPDLSLDSSGAPGTFIIYAGSPIATGGTSESSPLLAGLLTLVMQAHNGSLGLVNPVIHQLGGNSKTYQKAFTPITFGYIIPWVAKAGFNLATGWGSPNIGEIASLYGSVAAGSPTLKINVGIVNPTKVNFTDFTQGQKINVVAQISTSSNQPVTDGSFTASLETLGGTTAPVPLGYSPSQSGWTGTITVGNQSGIAYVNVVGTASTSQAGESFATTFVGYLANWVQPLGPFPWTFLTGLQTAVSITDLFGKVPPFPSTRISFQSYSILTNTYQPVASAQLNFSSSTGYYFGVVQSKTPDGPMVLQSQGGVIGYLPIVSGIGLLGTTIYPQVVAEPGSIAPGQSLTIVASITAPENIFLTISYASGTTLGATIAMGANVTATLINPSGTKVETVPLAERVCAQALRVCGAQQKLINGYVPIPASATPGLYTVLLNALYDDETTGHNYTGTYFGQVYVSSAIATPKITLSPSLLFEGQNATIRASITSPSGAQVTKGVYTALVYPKSSQNDYSALMHSTYASFSLIPLVFNPKLNLWVGNVTMPSPTNSGVVANVNANAEYYGGPYDVYVSGLSSDGMPTSALLPAQQDFFVQPYVYTTDGSVTKLGQTSRMALSNVTINAGSTPLSLSNDYFVGTDTIIGSNITILASQVSGTLNLQGGQVTLSGVTGGSVTATNAKLAVQRSSLSSLQLGTGATASVDSSSSLLSITPALPVLTISSPVANGNYSGIVNAQVLVKGNNITSISFSLDGKQLPPPPGSVAGPQVSYVVDTRNIGDGTHTFSVTATQTDQLSSTSSVSFATHNQLDAVKGQLVAANSTIRTLNGSVNTANSNIASLQNRLASANQTIGLLTYVAAAAAAVAVIGLFIGLYLLRRARAPWKY